MGLDQVGELGEERDLFFGDVVDAAQLRLGDPELWAGGQLAELTRQASPDARALERGRAELRLDLGGDADQMPAQAVNQAVTLGHQLVAVVAQHPDLMRLLV